MTKLPSLRSSLYAPFFQAEVGDLSGFRAVEDHTIRDKSLSLLAALQAGLKDLPREESAQAALESLFTRLIDAQVRAEYTAEQIQQLMWDAVRGLDFAEDGLGDDWEGSVGNVETVQKSQPTFSPRERE